LQQRLNGIKLEYLSARAEFREIKNSIEIESGIKRGVRLFSRKTRSRFSGKYFPEASDSAFLAIGKLEKSRIDTHDPSKHVSTKRGKEGQFPERAMSRLAWRVTRIGR